MLLMWKDRPEPELLTRRKIRYSSVIRIGLFCVRGIPVYEAPQSLNLSETSLSWGQLQLCKDHCFTAKIHSPTAPKLRICLCFYAYGTRIVGLTLQYSCPRRTQNDRTILAGCILCPVLFFCLWRIVGCSGNLELLSLGWRKSMKPISQFHSLWFDHVVWWSNGTEKSTQENSFRRGPLSQATICVLHKFTLFDNALDLSQCFRT